MPKRKKNPKKSVHISSSKSPRIVADPESWKKKSPVWAFNLYRIQEHRWSVECEDFAINCVPKLKQFEGMTWEEILRQTHDKGKSSNHFILSLDLLCREAQKILMDEQCYPVDQLFSLRIDNRRRLIGFLDDGIFCILWYDQNHEIVKSNKKHT